MCLRMIKSNKTSSNTKSTQHLQECTAVQYPPGWTGAFVEELAPEIMDRPVQLSLPAPVPYKAAPQQRPKAVAAAAPSASRLSSEMPPPRAPVPYKAAPQQRPKAVAAAAPAAASRPCSEMPPPEVPLKKRRLTSKQPPPEPIHEETPWRFKAVLLAFL